MTDGVAHNAIDLGGGGLPLQPVQLPQLLQRGLACRSTLEATGRLLLPDTAQALPIALHGAPLPPKQPRDALEASCIEGEAITLEGMHVMHGLLTPSIVSVLPRYKRSNTTSSSSSYPVCSPLQAAPGALCRSGLRAPKVRKPPNLGARSRLIWPRSPMASAMVGRRGVLCCSIRSTRAASDMSRAMVANFTMSAPAATHLQCRRHAVLALYLQPQGSIS